jgi:hypothetical protein
MFKNKRIQFLLMLSPAIFCFCALVALTIIPRLFPFEGLYGGDCVEVFGTVTVSGVVTDTNNQPVGGVQIRVIKAEGGCPQSMPIDEVVLSDENGNFITFLYFAYADPEAQIEISADGYSPCRFNYDYALRRESITLQLTIMLNEMMQVEGQLIDNEGRLIRDMATCS